MTRKIITIIIAAIFFVQSLGFADTSALRPMAASGSSTKIAIRPASLPLTEEEKEDQAIRSFLHDPAPLRMACKAMTSDDDYDWGDPDFIPDLAGIPNPERKPYAELWMGAHLKAPALVTINNKTIRLDRLVAAAKQAMLGGETGSKFEGLPYLFKVLVALKSLSIQVHPDAERASNGFEKDNEDQEAGKLLFRRYMDPHHKPELVLALTDFWAMRGFKPVHHIIDDFTELGIPQLEDELNAFRISVRLAGQSKEEQERALKVFYRGLMGRVKDLKFEEIAFIVKHVVDKARAKACQGLGIPADSDVDRIIETAENMSKVDELKEELWALRLNSDHENDMGVLSPFFLNIIKMKPGQSMFIAPRVIHAYCGKLDPKNRNEGASIELMADSDNVIRAGLTNKHSDVPELLDTVVFDTSEPEVCEGERISAVEKVFKADAAEFRLSEIALAGDNNFKCIAFHSADTFLVYEGGVEARDSKGNVWKFKRGDVFMMPAVLGEYIISAASGHAKLYRASVPPVLPARAGSISAPLETLPEAVEKIRLPVVVQEAVNGPQLEFGKRLRDGFFMKVDEVRYLGKDFIAKSCARRDLEDDFLFPQVDILSYLHSRSVRAVPKPERLMLDLLTSKSYIFFESLEKEFGPGKTLADILAGGKSYGPQEAVDMGLKFSRVIKSLLDNNVYHWDIKPEHIWVNENGDVFIFDFDLAFMADDVKSFWYRCLFGCGTDAYMSPDRIEHFQKRHEYEYGGEADRPAEKLFSHSDEIYSLAVVMLDMMGHNIFAEGEAGSRPRTDIPDDITAVLSRAFKQGRSGGERYSTIDEFISDLEDCSAKLKAGKPGEIKSASGGEAAWQELIDSTETALNTYSNVHRGAGYYSLISTRLFEEARRQVIFYARDRFDGVRSDSVVIFGTEDYLSRLDNGKQYPVITASEIGLPLGIGALIVPGNDANFLSKDPIYPGGGTVRTVYLDIAVWQDAPERFEPGTPNIIGVIMFAKALKMIGDKGSKGLFKGASSDLSVDDIFYNDELLSLSGEELLKNLRHELMSSPRELPTVFGDRQYVNFDNAASTPTFRPIWEAVKKVLKLDNKHQAAVVEEAKKITSRFFHAPLEQYDISFVQNTTEAINIIAEDMIQANPRMTVINSDLEHNSNELPWRSTTQAGIRTGDDGFIMPENIKNGLEYNRLQGRPALVSVTGASNVLGTITDIKAISKLCRQYGAILMVDAAQLAAHRPIDMEELGIDILVFSGHKMYAPFGTGGMIVRKGLLSGKEKLRMAETGISKANIAGIAAIGKALLFLEKIGMDLISAHEQELTRYMLEKLKKINSIVIAGNTDTSDLSRRTGVITFNAKDISDYTMAGALRNMGAIAVRNGCFCAHILSRRLLRDMSGAFFWGTSPRGLVRVSFGFYNTEEEIDHFTGILKRIVEIGFRNSPVPDIVPEMELEAVEKVYSNGQQPEASRSSSCAEKIDIRQSEYIAAIASAA